MRVRVLIQGAVQGVGFRPFIYRLAREMDVVGWVNNSAQGVTIEAEAAEETLQAFVAQIKAQKPVHAQIHRLNVEYLPAAGYTSFEIHHSEGAGAKSAVILPDLATCPDCLQELFDPADRRYRYPFTNCTNCGPRYSIITGVPYDRPNTTMRDFVMCEDCRAEYENPLDRRFHAQPIACPECGPQLALWNRTGDTLALRDEALTLAADAIRGGEIVALKGLGGFQLLVDARNHAAVRRLRERKHRPDKPLAVMYPTLEDVQQACVVSELEQSLLTSPAAPIVLLRQRQPSAVAADTAPGNPYIGVMLPYTPLHHLFMRELGFPVVATSGNLSSEPICIDEREAVERLCEIADLFLVHDRPIARQVDDSVVRVAAGEWIMLRRARGYAPATLRLTGNRKLMAMGAHQKNTVALTDGAQIILSQHIGDLDTPEANSAFERAITDLQTLYDIQPQEVVVDLHPDYRSTQYGESLALPVRRVQHHYAHILACLAENGLDTASPILGVAWDGTGYGLDGTIWGGEFLLVNGMDFQRFAYLQPFPLPGGEIAAREPRRCAFGLLYSLFGDRLPLENPALQAFTAVERHLMFSALQKAINAPFTSSMGRLFDAISAIIGLRQIATFEGQAAMELEFAAEGSEADECYPFYITEITDRSPLSPRILDVKPLIVAILEDLRAGVGQAAIAARFHHTLARVIVSLAVSSQVPRVALTGGCFQNRLLLELTVKQLTDAGIRPFWHREIPPNDGGIALGQLIAIQGLNDVSGSSG
jgi:hydrogenase maturation protein HypF